MQMGMRKLSIINTQEMSEGVNIAFATRDGKQVDEHFGTAKNIAVYRVSSQQYQLLQMTQFDESSDSYIEDKIAAKIATLDGCAAVYCCACGASAVKQLMDKQIQPLKVYDSVSIHKLINKLQFELSQVPSNWLARALAKEQQHSLVF